MQKNISIRISPREAADEKSLKKILAAAAGVNVVAVTGHHKLKTSIDARGKQVWVQLQALVFIQEPQSPRPLLPIHFPEVQQARHRVIIIGAGPAGLFAALKLLEAGIQPIILERGKDVRSRRRDLARMNKEGIVNPESNYCFGEGGAGTYSDGKLYTRSTKRGDIHRILQLLYRFGAPENVLYEAHPHIGTNKLPQIITAIRETLVANGAQYHFEARVDQILIENGAATGVHLASGDTLKADAVILATGHSARDVFQSLHQSRLLVEAKPFALGVRIEHPQELIDRVQYHCAIRDPFLPPAAYSLVQQFEGRGVFSFCMCPGGIIAPAATAPGEIVVNGWSPSKRNNPYANSGMVVSIDEKDYARYSAKQGPLAALQFQKEVEEKAFAAGGGGLTAPAQRMTDFAEGRLSATLPGCSYLPGLKAAPLNEVLPGFVYASLAAAFREFGKKMKGYYTNEAVVVATESRTSSPVRIPRDKETLQHPQASGLYPCGEGAGYAGGIVSAAMDGEKVADAIIAVLK